MANADALFGLTPSRAVALLRPVVTPSTDLTDAAAVTRLLALTVFAAVTEPGDTDAGLVNDLVGAEAAVRLVRGESGGDEVRSRLRAVGSPEDLPTVERLDAALERWRGRRDQADAARILERAAHLRATVITPDDPLWPHGLDDLERGRPLLLWVRGDPGRLVGLTRSIAMVGARAATGYGEHVAMESAAALSDRGFTIVSGGAYGIDAAAHRATVASGQVTVAFLAGGVDRLYPSGNASLLQRIIETGVVVSEPPPGSAPTRWRFLMRNRLIAAASQATVVVEAGRRSGSLNTAGHAAQLGRPLGAVPGPVTSPGSAGCHRLIREYDATCVTTADEMAELVDPLGEGLSATSAAAPADRVGRIRDASVGDGADTGDAAGGDVARGDAAGGDAAGGDVARGDVARGDAARGRAGGPDGVVGALRIRSGRTVRELMAATGLDAARVQAELGRLEALGRVRESGDGWHRRLE